MKILLVGINSKFIHSNLAIRYLYEYTSHKKNIELKEYTINNSKDYILKELYKQKADVICISTYIWNIEVIKEVIREYKKINSTTKFILGGPEATYDYNNLLINENIDIVMRGEGEETFDEICRYLIDGDLDISDIKGISYKENDEVLVNVDRDIMDMDKVPFVYKEGFEPFKNRIIYYETSRGCPYNCKYCLSSVEKKLRVKSLDIVFEELKFFLDNNIKQVKLVDRTFNADKKRAYQIWEFLIKNDNGITNFHFEISADIMNEDQIELLKKARVDLFQFEIGVQTTNKEVLDIINRKMKFEELSKVVKAVKDGNNIHQHLDLIAGLPGEDIESFRKSFNDVYNLEPEQLQLGFLKLIKGSGLSVDRDKHNLVARDKVPYEVLSSDKLSYEELLTLKLIEEMVESYYNTGRFYYSIKYIESKYETPFDFYKYLGAYYADEGYEDVPVSKLGMYDILLNFAIRDNLEVEILKELLKYDLLISGKQNKLCEFMKAEKDKSLYRNETLRNEYLNGLNDKNITLEIFNINVEKYIEENVLERKKQIIIFNYDEKINLLGHHESISVKGEIL
ncbi:MAG: B12-binding domain-containing radical SAM protein [Clostridia bacterium]|jgi:radical SAM superfamily enzyme YgiQ (UPF0313 family)|nr:B12-binding domain-containing radical SAM protein [Clostridia bacterium]